MDFSLFYAKLIGFYYVIVAIGMLVNAKNLHPFIIEVIQNKTLVIWTGLLSLLFGLAVVLTHNIWSGWPIIITVLGYLGIIRGMIRLCFTDWIVQLAPHFTQSKAYYSIGIVLLVFGAVLIYFGLYN